MHTSLGRKQSLGTLRLHAGDILSQCLRVFKDTGGEFLEKKFELANVSCGTLLIQFEFISVSQAPALEMDMEEAKEALIQTELKRLSTIAPNKEKKASSSVADVSSPNTPEKFEWRQSSQGKVVDPCADGPSSKKKTNKKSLRRRIASAFRSKEEKKRKKMEKMRKAYEEDTFSSIPEEAKEDGDGGHIDNEAKILTH